MYTAIWCVFSSLSRSASFTASEHTHMLNAYAYAPAASTYVSPLVMIATPMHSATPFRRAYAFESTPLDSPTSYLPSCCRPTTELSSISLHFSTASQSLPVFRTDRAPAFASEHLAATSAPTAFPKPIRPRIISYAALRHSPHSFAHARDACATRTTAATTASAVASLLWQLSHALSGSASVSLAHHIAVAPTAAYSLSTGAISAPLPPISTVLTCLVPVAAMASATQARLGSHLVSPPTPPSTGASSLLNPSGLQQYAAPARDSLGVCTAAVAPSVAACFASRRAAITARCPRRYTPVAPRAVNRSSKIAFACARRRAHSCTCFQKSTSCFCRSSSTTALMVRVSERPACTSALDPPFAFVAMLQLPVASAHTRLGLAVLPETSIQRHHNHSTAACLSAEGVYVTRSTILDCPLGAHAYTCRL
mmetsp:Transcript_52194/g.113694  ORF Transcript_52194/g.113694 Transcript_52194/m.113694 type:complete len:424 (-) Transcript_52194:493-1764(-)